MSGHRAQRQHHRTGRTALTVLVFALLIPEFLILAAYVVSTSIGCHTVPSKPCFVGPFQASSLVELGLQLGAGYLMSDRQISEYRSALLFGYPAVWAIACQAAILVGWSRASSRLVIGFVVMLLSGIVPYYGPALAIVSIAGETCHISEGGSRPCVVLGGVMGDAQYSAVDDAVRLTRFALDGVIASAVLFVVYACVVLVIAVRHRRPKLPAGFM